MRAWLTTAPVLLVLSGMAWLPSSALQRPAGPSAAPIASLRLRQLALSMSSDPQAVERFWQERAHDGGPLQEPASDQNQRLVTFVYRGNHDISSVRLESNVVPAVLRNDMQPLDQLGAMTRLDDSDIWYLTLPLPLGLRAPYTFVVSPGSSRGKASLDPLNPHAWARGIPGVEQSVLELPGAAARPWRAMRTVESKLEPLTSDGTGAARRPSYLFRGLGAPRALLVGLSEYTFRTAIPTTQILEYLAEEGEIVPTALVIAPQPTDGDERDRYESYVKFVAEQVIPEASEALRVEIPPERVVAAGTSRRGLVAAILADDYPQRVGTVLSMSGAFYWSPVGDAEPEWFTRRLAVSGRRSVRYWIAVGSLETVVTETNAGLYPVATNRHLRDVLTAKGYTLSYVEFQGVHHELNWETALADGLRGLLAPRPEP
jgi:enterochelin esterase-like enzyme